MEKDHCKESNDVQAEDASKKVAGSNPGACKGFSFKISLIVHKCRLVRSSYFELCTLYEWKLWNESSHVYLWQILLKLLKITLLLLHEVKVFIDKLECKARCRSQQTHSRKVTLTFYYDYN